MSYDLHFQSYKCLCPARLAFADYRAEMERDPKISSLHVLPAPAGYCLFWFDDRLYGFWRRELPQ